jgi:hypothetical protein
VTARPAREKLGLDELKVAFKVIEPDLRPNESVYTVS